MRVVIVTSTLNLGGAERQLVRLAVELKARGHEPHVLCLWRGGPLHAELDAAGVGWEVGEWMVGSRRFLPARFRQLPAWQRQLIALPTKPVRAADRARKYVELWRRIAELEPDVCHVFLPPNVRVVLPGARLHHIPVKVGGRRSLSSVVDVTRRQKLFTALASWCSDVVVGNSSAVIADVLESEWYRPRRTEVILNGVDVPEGVADPAAEPAEGVVVANLIGYKGHLDLVEALRRLPAPPRVHLLGEGPHRSVIEEAVERAGLGATVVFEGLVGDPTPWLLGAQFAVHPSHLEGLPNAVLEEMAAGLPCVVADVGGVRDLIEDGVEGFVVPVRDPGALAAAIAKLVADPELRRKMGAAARAKAEGFSWAASAGRHEALYAELLAAAAPSRRRVGSSTPHPPGSDR